MLQDTYIMETLLWSNLIFATALFTVEGALMSNGEDPCLPTMYKNLADTWRLDNNKVTTFATPKDDSSLLPGWYRFTVKGGTGLISAISDINSPWDDTHNCGTVSPLVMIGDHPQPGETVGRKLCEHYQSSSQGKVDCFTVETTIKVKNCNNFFVYELVTTVPYAAYCAATTTGNPATTTEAPTSRTQPTTTTAKGYNEWIEYNGAKYKFVNSWKNWPDAQLACRQENASLLAPMNDKEQSWVSNIIKANYSTEKFWIGIHDKISEGTWVRDDDGCPIKYSAWDQGEPNSYGGPTLNEDCAEMLGSAGGKWNDYTCVIAERFFICKWPVQISVCPVITTTTTTTSTPQTTTSGCPAFFSCQPGCLPELLRCDGYIDCWDFSDELNCVVAKNQVCQTPNPAANGDISMSRSKDGDLIVKYICLPGFKLKGRETRTCKLSTGKWLNKAPECVPKHS